MYLHEDRELFIEVVGATSEWLGVDIAIVEKDYYVTMILRLLSKKLNNVVFKGGTSLSKAFHVINRFSEDIDITFDEHIGEARRKKLKYEIMNSISDELGMQIDNWNEIESDRDYNYYLFSYKPINEYVENNLLSGVKIETALASYAFPTKVEKIDNYIRKFLEKDNAELIAKYGLNEFCMKVQSIERTYIDKVFALCDYYLEGKSRRYSRHMYDIYKLDYVIEKGEEFRELIREVRVHRAKMKICPSAQSKISIRALVHKFCENDFYKKDYEEITEYFVIDKVDYKDAVACLLSVVDEGWFEQ